VGGIGLAIAAALTEKGASVMASRRTWELRAAPARLPLLSGVRLRRHYIGPMKQRNWGRTVFISVQPVRGWAGEVRPTSIIQRFATPEEVAVLVAFV
jgi:NAD(P)-dependent dehydrogenase (short-subunit alcohol dehydrogenase family)